MASSNRYYSRFIPREEVGQVTQWQFGAVDGLDGQVLEPLIAAPEALAQREDAAPAPMAVPEDEHLQLLQSEREQAHAQGLAEGREQASLEWQQRMDDYVAGQGREAAERLAQLARALEDSLAGLQQGMAQEVLALAGDIARQVVRRELAINREALLPVVREALSMLASESRPAIVRLHPADWQALEQPLRAAHPSARIQWLADAQVQPGECMVESEGMVVDGTLDKRWRRAIDALGLTTVWQETGHAD